MQEQVAISFHQVRLELTTERDDFCTLARSYLQPMLVRVGAKPNVQVSLEWDTAMVADGRSHLEQLGRRIWIGSHRLQHTEIPHVPGLQVDVDWRDTELKIRAGYAWPTRRAKWFSSAVAWARERLFVMLIYYLVYFPCAWWLEHKQSWTLLHASAIASPDGGVIFSGLPGSGKSTVALAALTAPEWQVVSDNLLFTDGRQVYACPEPIHVDARTRSLADGLEDRARPTGRRFSHQRQDLEILPEARRSTTTPRALGFLHIGRETAVRPIDRASALRRLVANDFLAKEWMAYQETAAAMHQVWPTIGDHECRMKNLTELANSVPCYDVTIARDKDVAQATKNAIREMLDGNG